MAYMGLEELLRQIPIVSKGQKVLADHHNYVKAFLKSWLELNAFDVDAPDVYIYLNNIPNRDIKALVDPNDWNYLLDILYKIDGLLEQYAEEFDIGIDEEATYYYEQYKQYLGDLYEVSLGSLIESEQYNTRRQCLECLLHLIRKLGPTIYYCNWNYPNCAWDKVKPLIGDYTVFFTLDETSQIPKEDVVWCLNNYRIVFVLLIPGRATESKPYFSFEDVFYVNFGRLECLETITLSNNVVIHPCFRQVFGDYAPVGDGRRQGLFHLKACRKSDAIDYVAFEPGSDLTWAYRSVGKGYIMDLDYSGPFCSLEQFKLYMRAIQSCLMPKVRKIFYYYWVERMGACDSLYNILRSYAEETKGYFIDLR